MRPEDRKAIKVALRYVSHFFEPRRNEVWGPVPGAPHKAVSNLGRVLSMAHTDARGIRHDATILCQVGRLPRLQGPSALGLDPTIQRVVLATFDRMPEPGERALANVTTVGLPKSELGLRWSGDAAAERALVLVRGLASGLVWADAAHAAGRTTADFWRDQRGAEALVPRHRTSIERARPFEEPLREWAARAIEPLVALVEARDKRVRAALEDGVPWPSRRGYGARERA